ncbi:hypothetical protein B0H17DRAFT_1149893 [Mycena rosella]|uniref:Zn(2)-C6 fungal-type domain-containing protein n=1 Tax=Mycena rosella TaxID=1033263 RepID=A0AAD7BY00_MYCRO|nr:hypothetical protein B0H17DRAFT_1149893 [Mycena rosella]
MKEPLYIRRRVYIACLNCRKRKVKCLTDESDKKPCGRCIRHGLACQYLPVDYGAPKPRAVDKSGNESQPEASRRMRVCSPHSTHTHTKAIRMECIFLRPPTSRGPLLQMEIEKQGPHLDPDATSEVIRRPVLPSSPTYTSTMQNPNSCPNEHFEYYNDWPESLQATFRHNDALALRGRVIAVDISDVIMLERVNYSQSHEFWHSHVPDEYCRTSEWPPNELGNDEIAPGTCGGEGRSQHPLTAAHNRTDHQNLKTCLEARLFGPSKLQKDLHQASLVLFRSSGRTHALSAKRDSTPHQRFRTVHSQCQMVASTEKQGADDAKNGTHWTTGELKRECSILLEYLCRSSGKHGNWNLHTVGAPRALWVFPIILSMSVRCAHFGTWDSGDAWNRSAAMEQWWR